MFPDWYWLPYLKQLWTDKKLEKKFLWRRFDKIMFSDFFSPLKREINFSLFLLKSTKATELQKMQKKKKKSWVHTEWIATDPNYHLCWYSFFVLKLFGKNFKNITNDPVPKIPRNRYPKKRYLLGYYIQVPNWKSAVSKVSQVKYNSFICRNSVWNVRKVGFWPWAWYPASNWNDHKHCN